MTNSFVVLDNSGSMARFRYPIGGFDSAKFLAEAFLAAASPTNRIGLISFASRVKVESYFSADPVQLRHALAGVSIPGGNTELVDALIVSLAVDVERPDNLFVISDTGENASEFSMATLQAAIKAHDPKVAIYWIIPPLPPAFRPIPKFLVTPPGPKVLKELGAKIIDLSNVKEESKLLDAANRIFDGRIKEFPG